MAIIFVLIGEISGTKKNQNSYFFHFRMCITMWRKDILFTILWLHQCMLTHSNSLKVLFIAKGDHTSKKFLHVTGMSWITWIISGCLHGIENYLVIYFSHIFSFLHIDRKEGFPYAADSTILAEIMGKSLWNLCWSNFLSRAV